MLGPVDDTVTVQYTECPCPPDPTKISLTNPAKSPQIPRINPRINPRIHPRMHTRHEKVAAVLGPSTSMVTVRWVPVPIADANPDSLTIEVDKPTGSLFPLGSTEVSYILQSFTEFYRFS